MVFRLLLIVYAIIRVILVYLHTHFSFYHTQNSYKAHGFNTVLHAWYITIIIEEKKYSFCIRITRKEKRP